MGYIVCMKMSIRIQTRLSHIPFWLLILQEYMFYPAPKITVALLRGSLADEAGNISFERVAWLWS